MMGVLCVHRNISVEMVLTLGNEQQHLPDANAFQRLQQHLYEIWSVTSTALVNVCHPWTVRTPTNKYVIIAAVLLQPCTHPHNIPGELGASQPRDLFLTINHILTNSHRTRVSFQMHVTTQYPRFDRLIPCTTSGQHVSQQLTTSKHMLYSIFYFT